MIKWLKLINSQEVKTLATTNKSAYKIAKIQKWTKKTEKKTLANTMYKSSLRTAIKKAKEAIQNKNESADLKFNNAVKLIDKSAAKGIISKNTASRKKSHLAKSLKAIKAAE